MRYKFSSFCTVVLGTIALLFAGCSSSQHSTNGETYTKTMNGAVVNVSEDEYHIHMPTAFPAGIVDFHITNDGTMPHNFKIKGASVEEQLPTNLAPGQTADMTVKLVPGVYDVICPILGHADLGMRLSVTATQE